MENQIIFFIKKKIMKQHVKKTYILYDFLAKNVIILLNVRMNQFVLKENVQELKKEKNVTIIINV